MAADVARPAPLGRQNDSMFHEALIIAVVALIAVWLERTRLNG